MNTPYGRVDASRVEIPGQQEAFERANEIERILTSGSDEEYEAFMEAIDEAEEPEERDDDAWHIWDTQR